MKYYIVEYDEAPYFDFGDVKPNTRLCSLDFRGKAVNLTGFRECPHHDMKIPSLFMASAIVWILRRWCKEEALNPRIKAFEYIEHELVDPCGLTPAPDTTKGE